MTSESQPHTLGFCAARYCRAALVRSMVAAITFFAEPCWLEETCGTVLCAHQLIVHTLNKGAQSRESKGGKKLSPVKSWRHSQANQLTPFGDQGECARFYSSAAAPVGRKSLCEHPQNYPGNTHANLAGWGGRFGKTKKSVAPPWFGRTTFAAFVNCPCTGF